MWQAWWLLSRAEHGWSQDVALSLECRVAEGERGGSGNQLRRGLAPHHVGNARQALPFWQGGGGMAQERGGTINPPVESPSVSRTHSQGPGGLLVWAVPSGLWGCGRRR